MLLWLWLWHRPLATALIRPLAWEPPYAAGAAQEIEKKKKRKKKRKQTNKKTHYRMGENNVKMMQLTRGLISKVYK